MRKAFRAAARLLCCLRRKSAASGRGRLPITGSRPVASAPSVRGPYSRLLALRGRASSSDPTTLPISGVPGHKCPRLRSESCSDRCGLWPKTLRCGSRTSQVRAVRLQSESRVPTGTAVRTTHVTGARAARPAAGRGSPNLDASRAVLSLGRPARYRGPSGADRRQRRQVPLAAAAAVSPSGSRAVSSPSKLPVAHGPSVPRVSSHMAHGPSGPRV
jgi:hypothetical protein